MIWEHCPSWLVLPILLAFCAFAASEDYNVQQTDGSYEFGYENPDSYHHSKANSRNVVRGEFGGRSPKTGRIDVTQYTAGPRGYRPRGKNIARKYDLGQTRRGPIGSRDDPYFDPNEDPSYDFGFKTRTYQRQESANRVGDVAGKYSYLDDVGERHNVEYIAGKNTGFHVKTPFPDSNPRAYGPLFFRGRGKPLPRGRTSIQRGLDGSYRFVAAGPDQRRTEVSDSKGNIRGSYTYLDDKGVQHSVHYIAGPQIGYRVLKNVKGPHLPSVFPFTGPNIIPSDFYNYIDRNSEGDVFNPPENGAPIPGVDYNGDYDDGAYIPRPRPSRPRPKPSGALPRPRPPGPSFSDKPSFGKPSYDDDLGDAGDDDLFGGGTGSIGSTGSTTVRPPSSTGRPSTSGYPGEDSSSTGSGSVSGTTSGEDNNNDNEDYDDSDLFGGASSSNPPGPRPGSSRPGGTRPTQRPSGATRPPRPSYGDDDEEDLNDLDDGLFGNASDGGSTSSGSTGSSGTINTGGTTSKPPVITIADSGGRKTVVTNLGDKVFTVPPGVSVHAHVQSIDLYPYESKVPSPADQFRSETTRSFQRLTTRQINNDKIKEIATESADIETTTQKPTTIVASEESAEEDISTTQGSTTLPTTTTIEPPVIK